MPSPVGASEKPKLLFEIVGESAPDDWVLEGNVAVAEQLYKEQQESKKIQPIVFVPKLAPPIKEEVKPRNTKFAKGQCTDYVARKVIITWRGNANQWLRNAAAQGYRVDKVPVVGSILVTNESRYGHVAYIEEVNGEGIYISEWNYVGRYKLTYRTIPLNSPVFKGVIHVD